MPDNADVLNEKIRKKNTAANGSHSMQWPALLGYGILMRGAQYSSKIVVSGIAEIINSLLFSCASH
jgi:hypothetical protein